MVPNNGWSEQDRHSCNLEVHPAENQRVKNKLKLINNDASDQH